MTAVINDRPVARAFIEFLKTPIAHEVFMAQGQWYTAHKGVNPDANAAHTTRHGWLRAAGSILRDDSPHKDRPMSHQIIAALSRMLRGHVGLGASRLETLCMLVVGMVGARTVNLGHVATEAGRDGELAGDDRRSRPGSGPRRSPSGPGAGRL
jgi:hypothetical protein